MAVKNAAFSDVLGLVWQKFPGVLGEGLTSIFRIEKPGKMWTCCYLCLFSLIYIRIIIEYFSLIQLLCGRCFLLQNN